MAHFAKIENGKVTNCIVIKNDDCGGGDFPESEPIGQTFIASLGFDGEWLQTSYNKKFRGNFAGIGMFYNSAINVFHDDRPFPSWVLNDAGLWEAPKTCPGEGYYWDEETTSWVEALP